MKPRLDMRRVLSVGVLWGFLWATVTMVIGTIIGIIDPADIGPGEEPLTLAPIVGLVGLGCGLVFGLLASTVQRERSMLDLPLGRVALLGLIVAAALPLVTGKGLPEMLVTAPLGALSGLASIILLRTRTVSPAAH